MSVDVKPWTEYRDLLPDSGDDCRVCVSAQICENCPGCEGCVNVPADCLLGCMTYQPYGPRITGGVPLCPVAV